MSNKSRREAVDCSRDYSASHHHTIKQETHPQSGKNIYTWLLEKLFDYCGRPPIGISLWNGASVSGVDPVASIHIHSRQALLKLIAHADLYLGDLYASGSVSVEGDLVKLLETIYTGLENARPVSRIHKMAQNYLARPRKNTLEEAQSNIHQHYNLGNDFYRLWLCDNMQYTCAYYHSVDDSLEQAQIHKMDHICRKLRLQPGQTVIEAGCGWGGFARHMAQNYGVKVRSYNISEEQIRYAREAIRQHGLQDDQVEYILDDYRNAQGEYDAFVSVGMLEHVGVEYYQDLSAVINRCLKPNGSALLHFIGRNSPLPMNPWIEKRIFPGAYPPALSEVMPLFENGNFSILDIENLRLHYSRTVREWLNRYESHIQRVQQQFDDSFARAWRLYLAGSIASFNTGYLQLFQILFNKSPNNDIPLTRQSIYNQQAVNQTWTNTTLSL
ncbi:MAG: cyclopropane-fatty-acyl-phospholipid synthase family protein [Gammaproteobacteria bacterium]|jgi:cyclopropane-fatty-acyl-phospholipid synthase